VHGDITTCSVHGDITTCSVHGDITTYRQATILLKLLQSSNILVNR